MNLGANSRHPVLIAIALTGGLFLTLAGAGGQSARPLNDPVARLAGFIERGDVRLDFDDGRASYLPGLLERLDIHIDSQVLVFSKTSFQLSQISPATPRAIYFNDSVAVGAVQNGPVLELTAVDPAQGVIYYTMENQKDKKPEFKRRFAECLNCHGPAGGLVVSSVFPGVDGTPLVTGAFFEGIDHRTPLERRWGGWYVSGTHGSVEHMGNTLAPDPDQPVDLAPGGQNLTDLSGKFDTAKYLAPTSDIVALMTLEHQTGMTNRLITAGREFRRVSQTWSPDPGIPGRLEAAVEELVDYMLFAGEARLRDPVKGVSTFTETFPNRGPHDRSGRSLRDFDLQTRLFRYPLSYMIYSELFDGLPERARDRVYQRLYDILTAKDTSEKFAGLTPPVRASIVEILVDTKPGLPDYWRKSNRP